MAEIEVRCRRCEEDGEEGYLLFLVTPERSATLYSPAEGGVELDCGCNRCGWRGDRTAYLDAEQEAGERDVESYLSAHEGWD